MTTFIVNGKAHKIEMRDENGIDGSADFIGNTAHGMEMDEECNYIATQEDLEWWKNMIAEYQNMERVIKQYYKKYGQDTVDRWLENSFAFSCDLEDQPKSVLAELKNLDEEYASL